MAEQELMIAVRNVLLANIMLAALAPEKALHLPQQIVRRGKALIARLSVMRPNSRLKKFLEIDMSKFEP